LLPGAAHFAMLVNPTNPNAELNITEARAATSVIGRQIEVLTASTNRDIDTAFASLVEKRADALLLSPEPLFTTVESNSSRWQPARRCPGSITSASLRKSAG